MQKHLSKNVKLAEGLLLIDMNVISLHIKRKMGTRLLFLFLLLSSTVCRAQTDSVARRESLDEVIVVSRSAGQRVGDVQIGVEKVDVGTMSRVPALLGERDVIKSLQLLPGVKSEGDGLGGYQVRGGTSAQNQILLDGAAVYNAGHLMGLFSAFNDEALRSVELYKGLMPARFGGGVSSVLNLLTRVGDRDHHHFGASVGLLSAKVSADGPMGKNGSSYMAAGRASYLNFFIKSINKYADNSLSFYDLNASMNFMLSESDQLNFAVFRGYDIIDVESALSLSWSNTTGSLSWLHKAGHNRYATTQLVASSYMTDQSVSIYSLNYGMEGFNKMLTLRHYQTWMPSGLHTVNFGGETTFQGLQSADWNNRTFRQREKRDAWLSSAWLGDDISILNRRLQLSLGLRLDVFSALGGKPYYHLDDAGNITETFYPRKWSIVKSYAYLQPRVSIAWKIRPTFSVKTGYSRTVQSLQPIRNSSMTLPFDRLTMASNNVKPQVADQVATGLAWMTPNGEYDLTLEGYYKRINHVYDYRDGKSFYSEIEIERLLKGGRGRAYGLEFAARKNAGRMTGWLSYTLSWAENQIDGIMDNQWYTASNDRRHDFVVVAMYQLNPRWELSASWRFTTGQAMTAPAAKYEIDGNTFYYFDRRNEQRAPDYHRLDLSATYTRKLKRYTHVWAFGIYNAYHRYNPFFVRFEPDDSKPSGTKAVVTTLFGFIPSVSFTFKY